MIMNRMMRHKDLAAMCGRLGTALSAGVDLRRAWQSEAERHRGPRRQPLLEIGQQLHRGVSLTDAVARQAEWFPPLFRDLIEVGEATGRLDDVLHRLAEHYEARVRLARTFQTGILWPLIQLSVAIVLIGVLIVVSGWVSRLSGERIDFLGLGLVGVRGALVYGLMVASFAVCVLFAVRGLSRGWLSTGPLYQIVRGIPGLGSWLETLSLARFSWGLALAVESGLDIRRSVRLATHLSNNPRMLAGLQHVDTSVARGDELYQALRGVKAYPHELLNAIEVGEQTGKLDEAMKRLSRQYEKQAEAQGKSVTVMGAVFIGGLVALLIVAAIIRLGIFYSNMIQAV